MKKKKTIEKSDIKLPDKVPVFPLPNVILFPEVELPLYIFEPRYRQMLADCCASNKFMAISLLKQGWEKKQEPLPSHDVVGVGFVRAVFENPDGTSHILLKGVGRAGIVRYVQMEPYRVAKIKELPDTVESSQDLTRLLPRLQKLLSQKLRFVSENPETPLRFPKKLKDPFIMSHIASFMIQASPYLKQDLLETTNINCRIRHLIELLEEEIVPPGTQN